MLLRVACAYRTVSAHAVQVITGTPLMDLLVKERARTWAYGGVLPPQDIVAAKEATRASWQNRWSTDTDHAGWTRRLIPQLGPWLNCKHRSIDYFITQFLSGHGSFRNYTWRIGKDPTNDCRYCDEEDTPEHTIFRCRRWEVTRSSIWTHRRGWLSPDNIIGEMLACRREWKVIAEGIRAIMCSKEREERGFQAGNPPPPW